MKMRIIQLSKNLKKTNLYGSDENIEKLEKNICGGGEK